jgi:hypothetical protein
VSAKTTDDRLDGGEILTSRADQEKIDKMAEQIASLEALLGEREKTMSEQSQRIEEMQQKFAAEMTRVSEGEWSKLDVESNNGNQPLVERKETFNLKTITGKKHGGTTMLIYDSTFRNTRLVMDWEDFWLFRDCAFSGLLEIKYTAATTSKQGPEWSFRNLMMSDCSFDEVTHISFVLMENETAREATDLSGWISAARRALDGWDGEISLACGDE